MGVKVIYGKHQSESKNNDENGKISLEQGVGE